MPGPCSRIFLKNEHRDRYCTGCARRKRRDNGMFVCGRCFKEFERKVWRQRYCSDYCREGVARWQGWPGRAAPIQSRTGDAGSALAGDALGTRARALGRHKRIASGKGGTGRSCAYVGSLRAYAEKRRVRCRHFWNHVIVTALTVSITVIRTSQTSMVNFHIGSRVAR